MNKPIRHMKEDGSETLLATISLLVVIFALLAIIQLGFAAYSAVVLTSSIEEASLRADFSEVSADDTLGLDQAVTAALLKVSPGLASSKLSTGEAKWVKTTTKNDKATIENNIDLQNSDVSEISTIERKTTTATLEANIYYQVPTFVSAFGFDGNIQLSRPIKVEVPLKEQMEVS